jgi:hypothetical protein
MWLLSVLFGNTMFRCGLCSVYIIEPNEAQARGLPVGQGMLPNLFLNIMTTFERVLVHRNTKTRLSPVTAFRRQFPQL